MKKRSVKKMAMKRSPKVGKQACLSVVACWNQHISAVTLFALGEEEHGHKEIVEEEHGHKDITNKGLQAGLFHNMWHAGITLFPVLFTLYCRL